MTNYWRKVDENGEEFTHLSHGGDHSICGEDLCGDELCGTDITPIEKKTRITCPHCLQIIDVVRDHIKREKP